jgi:hypothetical protein
VVVGVPGRRLDRIRRMSGRMEVSELRGDGVSRANQNAPIMVPLPASLALWRGQLPGGREAAAGGSPGRAHKLFPARFETFRKSHPFVAHVTCIHPGSTNR